MSIVTQPARASLAEAKAAVIDAAKAIDPLAPMRRRPFISVAVAAGVGAVLGMNRGRLVASVSLTRAISSLVRPVAFVFGRYVVARASHRATETRKEPARSPDC